MSPDGMLAYQIAMENPSRDDPNWPLPSFDAGDWAEAFCGTLAAVQGVKVDRAWMETWFADALMRGWDEHARRVSARVNQRWLCRLIFRWYGL